MSRKCCHVTRVLVFLVILLTAAVFGLSGCGDGALDLQRSETELGGNAGDTELNWLNTLKIPWDELEGKGEIRQTWQLRENLVLLNQVHGQENGFHLFHVDSGKLLPIVPPKEN